MVEEGLKCVVDEDISTENQVSKKPKLDTNSPEVSGQLIEEKSKTDAFQVKLSEYQQDDPITIQRLHSCVTISVQPEEDHVTGVTLTTIVMQFFEGSQYDFDIFLAIGNNEFEPHGICVRGRSEITCAARWKEDSLILRLVPRKATIDEVVAHETTTLKRSDEEDTSTPTLIMSQKLKNIDTKDMEPLMENEVLLRFIRPIWDGTGEKRSVQCGECKEIYNAATYVDEKQVENTGATVFDLCAKEICRQSVNFVVSYEDWQKTV